MRKNTLKLPYAEHAYVPRKKLTHYLLSEVHMVGRLKAKFFCKIGFDATNTDMLERALLIIAREDIAMIDESPHGKKYVIDGKMLTPNGNNFKIRTVWIIEENDKKPRFVTAYPV
jgi:hypothetical protein